MRPSSFTLEQIAEAYYRIAGDLRQGFVHIADRELFCWFASADLMCCHRPTLFTQDAADIDSLLPAPRNARGRERWRAAA